MTVATCLLHLRAKRKRRGATHIHKFHDEFKTIELGI